MKLNKKEEIEFLEWSVEVAKDNLKVAVEDLKEVK